MVDSWCQYRPSVTWIVTDLFATPLDNLISTRANQCFRFNPIKNQKGKAEPSSLGTWSFQNKTRPTLVAHTFVADKTHETPVFSFFIIFVFWHSFLCLFLVAISGTYSYQAQWMTVLRSRDCIMHGRVLKYADFVNKPTCKHFLAAIKFDSNSYGCFALIDWIDCLNYRKMSISFQALGQFGARFGTRAWPNETHYQGLLSNDAGRAG